ncbi:MAG: hypothetical protein JNL01_00870 [Bdellovibrionales bacterium]|nr:hypothetical protein [Bdellovibrionales bacterium]
MSVHEKSAASAIAPGIAPLIAIEGFETSRSWRPWIIAAILALLIHLLTFRAVPWLDSMHPNRVSVVPISSDQIENIRKAWEKKDRGFVVDREMKGATKEEPKDEAFLSGRNQTVKKQTRSNWGGAFPTRPRVQTPKSLGNIRQPKGPLSKFGVPIGMSAVAPPQEALDGAEAVPQWMPDKDIEVGAETILNTRESVYSTFYDRVAFVASPIWHSLVRESKIPSNTPAGEYVTEAEIVLEPDTGRIVDVLITRSSGVPEIDQCLRYAMVQSKAFQNPPKDWKESDGMIHFRITSTLGLGTAQYKSPFEVQPKR